MSGEAGCVDWLRPAPWDGSAASLAEHAAAIGRAMAGTGRLWLGPFVPPDRLPSGLEGTVLVVPTSGSTGTAKAVALDRAALLASQDATASLIGHGLWLPLLPPTHIAGVQVLARAHRTAQLHGLAGPALPDPLPDLRARFDAALFSRLAEPALDRAAAQDLPALTSLVPTQLGRVLADEAATALLARFAAVLVGGAATPPALLAAARERGVAVRTTYGSSETAGGCVYDGVPLPGVRLSLADAADEAGATRADGVAADGGRLCVRSPTLALGYLRADGAAEDGGAFLPAGHDGERSFLTSDLARIEAGRLSILGRADDVIITGGRKVLPQDVESAIEQDPGLAPRVRAVVVVGVPDPDWGQRLEALVVPADPAAAADLPERIRTVLRGGAVPPHAVPKAVRLVPELPLRGIGKIDRAAARALASSPPRP